MKLEDMVAENYGKLNSNDRLIWNYVYCNKEECSNLPIEMLADRCSVSRSTVMRFAQKIGLAGYSELKTYLRWETLELHDVPEHFVDLVCQDKIKTIQHFRDLNFDNICSVLHKAQRIFAYGTGIAQRSVCSEFKRMMLSLNIIVEHVPGEGEMDKTIRMMNKNDVVLIVSKSGSGEYIRDAVFRLKSRGVPIVSLTNYGDNPLARMSDYNLFVTIEKIPLPENANFESMTLLFIVLEILFLKYVEYSKRIIESLEP